jgi:hypothetical protein
LNDGGLHIPLIIKWSRQLKGGQINADLDTWIKQTEDQGQYPEQPEAAKLN